MASVGGSCAAPGGNAATSDPAAAGSRRQATGNLAVVLKKQIALVLAGTAASVAGGLRLVQELVDRGDRHSSDTGLLPDGREQATPPPAPSSTTSPPESPSPGSPPQGAETGKTNSEPSGAATAKAPSGASKAQLYEIATSLAISGRSKMNKAELIDAINTAG